MNTLTTTNKELFQPEVKFDYFTDFANHYITRMIFGEILTNKKVIFSADTIRQYKVMIDHFLEFENTLNGKVSVHQLNKKVLTAFEMYLHGLDLAENSVYLYLSKIKALGNVLFDEEILARPVRFKTPKKITTQVYLSMHELKQMRACEALTSSQQYILDLFILQSFTGMRFGSLMQFIENPMAYIRQNGDKTYIDITSKKTGEQSCIPLSKIVYDLLNKYNFNFERKSEEFVNRSIKTIARKSGIDTPVAIQVTRNSQTETVIVPKYSLIKTHSARRGYLTLIKQYITDDEAIMAISGHTSSQAMRNYVRSSKLDRILPYMDNEFFKIEI